MPPSWRSGRRAALARPRFRFRVLTPSRVINPRFSAEKLGSCAARCTESSPSTVLISSFLGNAEIVLATARSHAVGLSTNLGARPTSRAARKLCPTMAEVIESAKPTAVQLGPAGAGALHGGGYNGTPPPPMGVPGPTRPYLQHFSAGMPGGGPPGSCWKVGDVGGGANG